MAGQSGRGGRLAEPRGFVPGNLWRGARPLGSWVLVARVAYPGFDEAGWVPAPEGRTPGSPSLTAVLAGRIAAQPAFGPARPRGGTFPAAI